MSERDDFQLDDIVEVTDDIYSNGLADAFMGKSDKLPANSRGKITDIDFLCDPNGYSIEVTFDKGGSWWLEPKVLRVLAEAEAEAASGNGGGTAREISGPFPYDTPEQLSLDLADMRHSYDTLKVENDALKKDLRSAYAELAELRDQLAAARGALESLITSTDKLLSNHANLVNHVFSDPRPPAPLPDEEYTYDLRIVVIDSLNAAIDLVEKRP